jgi:hypothetical protein
MKASLMVGSWGLTRMPVGDGGDLVAREHADRAGGSVQCDDVDEDDAVVAGEVGREVEGGGAEVFEGVFGGGDGVLEEGGLRR